MRTVLFVPGFREHAATRDYQNTIRAIESKGYTVAFVPIAWKRTAITDWVQELSSVYAQYDPKDTILAGFSFGAMTALVTAASRNPAELWLFSLSAYFSDDIPKQKPTLLTILGHRRVSAFKTLDFAALAKHITCKTLLVAGEVEAKKYPLLGQRAEAAQRAMKRSRLILVPGADHDVADQRYTDAITGAI